MLVQNTYEWSTHRPLIKAVMDLYKPKTVLELGVGEYSTPLFIEYKVKFDCIDSDPIWVEYISQKYNINVIHHDMGDITEAISYSKLSQEQKLRLTRYYSDLKISGSRLRLLFVDQNPASRLISINILKKHFDLIIYHDHDEAGFEDNSYDLIDPSGFNWYYLDTPRTGTGILIRTGIDAGFDLMDKSLERHIENYKKIHPDCEYMKLKVYGMASGK